LTDFALQFRDPVIVGPFPARAHKSLRAVLVQFPAPPVQIARMNLQRPGHFRRALPPANCRIAVCLNSLLNFLRDFISDFPLLMIFRG